MESTLIKEPVATQVSAPRKRDQVTIVTIDEIQEVEHLTEEIVKVEDEMEEIRPQHVHEPGPAFRLEIEDNIGLLIFDVPNEKVNILSTPVMHELDRCLDEIKSRPDLKALVFLSGKEGNFIAGAKIEEIENITDPKDGAEKAGLGQAVFGKIAALPFPVIAVINGACVGGGLELVLACHFRLAHDSEKTRLGLPEVRLGIIPGFGGTQRLPRLIGIQRALDFILTGKLVDAGRAYKAGMVDRVIPKEFPHRRLRHIGLSFAQEIQNPETRRKIEARRNRANPQTLLLEKNLLGRKVLFDQARRRTLAETKGHYPAPELALEAVEKGFSKELAEGLKIEANLLGKAIVTNVSKNLVKVFYLTEIVKKDPGVENYAGSIHEFHKIGVLGAGLMGGGIAQLMAHNDLPARMKDINLAAVAKGMEAAAKVFGEAVKKRRMKPKEMQDKMALISGTTDYSGFKNLDLVIEAIVEILDVKKKVFAEIDAIVPPHCILASNTSSLSITEMAKATQRPDKFAGLHFFNPVHRMPLVEVIRGESTSDETIASLVAFAKKIGKTPIVVMKDSAGFLVNRILGTYMAEAGRTLKEGATIEQIDEALVKFGMPMGPINLFDEVGLDVAAKVSHILENAFGSRMAGEGMMDKIVETGRLGKKNGKGFYIYEGKEKKIDPAIYGLIGKAGKFEGTAGEIQDRCVLPMINEAAMCLAEGVVRRPEDVDVGMIFGTGFPPFLGGLLRYADGRGIDNVVGKLETLAGKYGERFKPAERLMEMKRAGKKFY
jgi:3-hydroxyacyl-CoA dehydrogenase/enoyl-CoA hydratase/3-hydroxybutyryl-CoA epimerase